MSLLFRFVTSPRLLIELPQMEEKEVCLLELVGVTRCLRMALQHHRWFIHQIVLSESGTVLQVHKVRDVVLRQKDALSFHPAFLYKSVERMGSPCVLDLLLHHIGGAGSPSVFERAPAILTVVLPLGLTFFVYVEIEIGARPCQQRAGEGLVAFIFLVFDVYQTAPWSVTLIGSVWIPVKNQRES